MYLYINIYENARYMIFPKAFAATSLTSAAQGPPVKNTGFPEVPTENLRAPPAAQLTMTVT